MKYERLTERDENGYIDLVCGHCEYDSNNKCDVGTHYCTLAVKERLCELEDKIENGTLIDMPRIIHPNKAEWYVQYQYPSGVIQYYICFSEAEAEKKLKELKRE